MLKRACAFVVLVAAMACGGGNSSSITSPSPSMFSLNGQVTDSRTGIGISGAAVSVADRPDASKSTMTDATGSYRFTELRQSGFTVNVSASNYLSQSKSLTLTSNQALSFQLTPASAPSPSAGVTITFDGLTGNGSAVSSYTESGFTVRATSGNWVAVTSYGKPAPFIQFVAPAGTTVTGEIQVTAGGAAFGFKSVDLYSSTTRIPYTITGLRNSTTAFTGTDTLPNTFGNFATVVNARPDLVDTLVIRLSNPSAPCCKNPMGIDNIMLTR